jgi:drug/metabolite transporter (DMT)-like permease
MAAGMTGATLGLAPIAFGMEAGAVFPRSAEGWTLIAALGLATAFLPQLLYTVAAPRVGATRTSAAGSFELPTMLAIGWIVFGETIGSSGFLASALVLAAIALSPAIRPQAPDTDTARPKPT